MFFFNLFVPNTLPDGFYIHTHFLYKQHFFSTQPQYCLTISRTEFQMLLRCCLTHVNTIIMRHILHSSNPPLHKMEGVSTFDGNGVCENFC